jgi:hypothetical protein
MYSPHAYTSIPAMHPKDIRDRIMSLHHMAAFTHNGHTLITEKAGKAWNGMYTESAKSWLINPLITHAVLIKEEAALFFAPLPTNAQLIAVGHQLRNLSSHTHVP